MGVQARREVAEIARRQLREAVAAGMVAEMAFQGAQQLRLLERGTEGAEVEIHVTMAAQLMTMIVT